MSTPAKMRHCFNTQLNAQHQQTGKTSAFSEFVTHFPKINQSIVLLTPWTPLEGGRVFFHIVSASFGLIFCEISNDMV